MGKQIRKEFEAQAQRVNRKRCHGEKKKPWAPTSSVLQDLDDILLYINNQITPKDML
uniref:Uncharacterized protein n=1 Tax=Oryza sativa subsp. japonica TaxID=39947 RepID=Q654G9_ORYSJ|nr:hypothetical protein [Oryza sativa Japonica Group]